MVVKHNDGRDIMLMSYWHEDYVPLDVTTPPAESVVGYGLQPADPAGCGAGDHPEGNADQAEFTADKKIFFATDGGFNPYRVEGTFGGGQAGETGFTAIEGGETKAMTKEMPLSGPHAVPAARV